MSSKITIHQGDKEVFDFPVFDRTTKQALTSNDVTAATFVAKIGSVTLTATLGSGIQAELRGGSLYVVVTLASADTETLAAETEGGYQLRLTRGTIGPDTVAEGAVKPVLKVEG